MCEVVLGGTPRTAVDAYWDGSIPWLTPGEMGKILGPYVEDTKRKLTEEGLKAGSSLFPSRSVVLSTRAPIGYVFINRVPMCTNQGCKTLVPSSEVWPEYLYFNLLGRTDELNQLGTGTTFKELATGALKGIEIPLPPLSVQREIVARLERELGAVDKLAKKFEELEAAAEAEFKAELKETFEEIKHRGEMHRRSSASEGRFGEAEPEGRASVCETQRLGDVCELINGDRGKNYPAKSKLHVKGVIPFISALNINHGNVETERLLYLDEKQYLSLRAGKLKKGDIALCIRGSLGKYCVYPFDRGAIASSLVILRCYDVVVNRFVAVFIESPFFYSQISGHETGTAQPNLAAKNVARFEIPIPSLSVQREVVARLDAAKAKKEKLVAAARRGRETAALMRKAILKEAFE